MMSRAILPETPPAIALMRDFDEFDGVFDVDLGSVGGLLGTVEFAVAEYGVSGE
jgi:hypothetical protein